MKTTFEEAIKHRRTYYNIDNQIDVSDQSIKNAIEAALINVPSAFNSQSTRIVLLLGESHSEFWDMVKTAIRNIVSDEAFAISENKINTSFASGYGTVLFYEDKIVVNQLQDGFPAYADRFPVWSEHTSAMHQFAVWTMLEGLGLGASLQHYNPLVDKASSDRWDINEKWQLIAQMPFGRPLSGPGEKVMVPIKDRFFVF